jgi:hypothetical protein
LLWRYSFQKREKEKCWQWTRVREKKEVVRKLR